ncbi:MAG TPA: prolipoprotein diacylglyceryl transferase [Thermoanaerobaculia bacterium]|jgi:phosphatidylglycerol:prolipoprotein diacylglycerol transferase|nr:prolipoprotein diacylglyceryl transferase [Thermoanaerobaculia bacterium]
MIQELFHIGSFAISPFGVLLVAAFVASYLQLRWGLIYQGVGDDEDASALVFAAGVGGILGSKIYYAILYGDWHLLFDRSGLVWYGGFILGAAAVIWTLRRRHLPAWQVCDAAMPGLALGYGVGRIGCFLVGDDYGRPTDGPLGVIFPHGLPETTAGNLRDIFHYQVPASIPDSQLVPVHPTQLYETALGIAIWGVGVWLLRRGGRPGTTSVVVLALLALERFGIEFLRAKDDRFFRGLTVAQGLSLAILVALVGLWVRRPLAPALTASPARRTA